MKQIVIAFLIILGLSPAILAQEGFKITGRLGGSLGGNLVLVGSSSEGAVKLGETTMIDGNFEFSGSVEGVMPAYILTEEQQPIATVMLENLEYTLVAGESGIEVLGGGESQKIWNEFEVINRHVLKEIAGVATTICEDCHGCRSKAIRSVQEIQGFLCFSFHDCFRNATNGLCFSEDSL